MRFQLSGRMKQLLIPLIVTVFLLGDGLVFGLWTHRWQSVDQLPAAVARLQELPLDCEDWQGQSLPDLDVRVVAQAGFAGYLHRRLQNRRTGAAVNVLLACGPFGPLSVHTPEVCYAGSGFVQQSTKLLYKETCGVPVGDALFWTAKFHKPEALEPGQLRIFWAWNAGEGWKAPENPRFAFAGACRALQALCYLWAPFRQ